MRKKLRVKVWHRKQEITVARARVSRTGKLSCFSTQTSRALGAVQRTLGAGRCGREKLVSVSCSLHFAKASATTLSQQEKNDTADVQRGRVHKSGFICSVASAPSRRCTFGEFESLAVDFRRALHH